MLWYCRTQNISSFLKDQKEKNTESKWKTMSVKHDKEVHFIPSTQGFDIREPLIHTEHWTVSPSFTDTTAKKYFSAVGVINGLILLLVLLKNFQQMRHYRKNQKIMIGQFPLKLLTFGFITVCLYLQFDACSSHSAFLPLFYLYVSWASYFPLSSQHHIDLCDSTLPEKSS